MSSYFGNKAVVLEYDGVTWRKIHVGTGEHLYLQQRDLGLQRLEDEQLVQVSDDPLFRETDVTFLADPLVAWSENGTAKEPWTAELEETRLEAHIFAQPEPSASFMLLLEERALAGETPFSLLCLGLTNREAEVLFWIAHGKTTPEIGIILDAARNTVKKHVQNIMLKLGVETRLAAALRATEILGLSDVETAP